MSWRPGWAAVRRCGLAVAVALALATLAGAEGGASLPLEGEFTFEEGDYRLHSFALGEPSLVTGDLVAHGFDPALIVARGDEESETSFLAASDPAWDAPGARFAFVAARPGPYTVAVFQQRAWEGAPVYTLRLRSAPLEGEPLLQRSGPLNATTTEAPEPMHVAVQGVRLPADLVGAGTVLVRSTAGAASWRVVGGDGLAKAAEGVLTDELRGCASLVLEGPAQETTVEAASSPRPLAEQSLEVEVGADEVPRVPAGVGSTLPVPGELGDRGLRVWAKSPAVYLTLTALDASGAVVATATEEPGEGAVTLEVEPGAGVRQVVVSADEVGDNGEIELKMEARDRRDVTPERVGQLRFESSAPVPAAGVLYRLELAGAAEVEATAVGERGQLVAVDAGGRWRQLSSRPASGLETGDRVRVLGGAKDLVLERGGLGWPDEMDGLPGQVVEVVAVDPSDDTVQVQTAAGDSWWLTPDGVEPLEPRATSEVLRLKEGPGELYLLHLNAGSAAPAVTVTRTSPLHEASLDLAGAPPYLEPDDSLRLGRVPLALGADEVVEARLVGTAPPRSVLRLMSAQGAVLASAELQAPFEVGQVVRVAENAQQLTDAHPVISWESSMGELVGQQVTVEVVDPSDSTVLVRRTDGEGSWWLPWGAVAAAVDKTGRGGAAGPALVLTALVRAAGTYSLELLVPADGAGGRHRLEVGRSAVSVRAVQVAPGVSTTVDLAEKSERLTRRHRLAAAAGDALLVRWWTDGEAVVDVLVKDASGRVLASCGRGDDLPELTGEAQVYVEVPTTGQLEVVTTADGPVDETRLEVRRVPGPPSPAVPPRPQARLDGRSPASDFEYVDAGGRATRLGALRGQVVVLDFWASWCVPCRRSLPAMEQIHQRFRDRGLVVLGVNSESRDVIARAERRFGLTFHTVEDQGDAISSEYGVEGIPHTVVVDRSGRVAADLEGLQEDDLLARLVERELAVAGG